jgi:hypothetical protein
MEIEKNGYYETKKNCIKYKVCGMRCVIAIKILRLGLQLKLYELILGNPNRLKLPLFFVRFNRFNRFDYISITSLFYMEARLPSSYDILHCLFKSFYTL